MPKVNKARQKYLEQVQRNRIVAQLNALYGAGNTVEDVRNAGKNAWKELGGQNIVHDPLTGQYYYEGSQPPPVATPANLPKQKVPYTVGDGDTASSIAKKAGMTVEDFLRQNPEMKYVKTGMVVNTTPAGSRPGSPEWRAQNIGGVGLPSSGPLGAAPGKAAPQVVTPTGYNPAMRGRGYNQPANIYSSNPFYKPGMENVLNRPGYQLPGTVKQKPFSGSPLYSGQQPPATPLAKAASTPLAPSSMNDAYFRRQFESAIYGGWTPNAGETRWLEQNGFIKKAPTKTTTTSGGPVAAGYYYTPRRRGGGRGGGGGRVAYGGGGYQTARLPAFSTGAGGFSLINWRI